MMFTICIVSSHRASGTRRAAQRFGATARLRQATRSWRVHLGGEPEAVRL
ncbi:hypothetical protein [Micromonospora sp. LOL_023]